MFQFAYTLWTTAKIFKYTLVEDIMILVRQIIEKVRYTYNERTFTFGKFGFF